MSMKRILFLTVFLGVNQLTFAVQPPNVFYLTSNRFRVPINRDTALLSITLKNAIRDLKIEPGQEIPVDYIPRNNLAVIVDLLNILNQYKDSPVTLNRKIFHQLKDKSEAEFKTIMDKINFLNVPLLIEPLKYYQYRKKNPRIKSFRFEEGKYHDWDSPLYENLPELEEKLTTAIYNKNLSMVKALIKQGADVNARYREYRYNRICTMLGDAVDTKDERIVQALLDAGAEINADYKPLHSVVEEGNLEMVKFLIDRGADPNIKGFFYDKGTTLHVAARKGNFEMVNILVNGGADASIKNEKGKTAADVAGNKVIEAYLRGRERVRKLKRLVPGSR